MTRPGHRLHHLGFIVASITESVAAHLAQFQLTWDERIFHDPIQKVRVTFLASANVGEPSFELVEPAHETSPVLRFLKTGGGLHHVCYEVDDLAASLAEAKALGSLVLRTPRPAVAFDGRHIAWVQTKHKVLVEYLERTLNLEN